MNDDEWHHILFTINNTTQIASIYIDGQLDGILTGFSHNIPISTFTIGGINFTGNGGEAYIGKLDDFRIYNRALATSEITVLYNENTCFKTVSVTDTLRISSIAGINTLPESFGSIKVYPNPAHDILNISISKPSTDYSIKIADNMGKTVYTSAMTSNNLQINLSQFTAKGLYLIQILDNTNKVLDVRKLVLE